MIEDVVEQLFQEIVSQSNKRMPDASATRRMHLSIRKLLMDTISVSAKTKHQHWASIHKNKNHYTASRYSNPDISYRIHIERVYEPLLELGYLKEIKAGLFTDKERYLTRYEATPKLITLIDPNEVAKLPVYKPVISNPELIRVRTEVDGFKQLVKYPDTPQTVKMRINVKFINDVLSKQWFDLELTDDEFEQLEERMHQRSLERNEGEGRLRLQDRMLYRVFNTLEFNEGGRFYGGWWEMVPSEYRRKILINGKRTEELDFSTLHPTILYAQAGIPLKKDAYNIELRPRAIPDGYSHIDFRTVVKRAFNAMLNARHELRQPPRELKLKSWGIKWDELVESIRERHEPIGGQFFSGAGLRLQFEDSQIAESLMIEFARTRGLVPLLPVHDSFICHHGYVREVEELMVKEFKNRFGIKINVNPKPEVLKQGYKQDDNSLDDLLSYKDRTYDLRIEAFGKQNVY